MTKIYFINVGANTSHEGRARGPILSDGSWTYVPFPRDKEHEHGQNFPDSAIPCIRVPSGFKCHLDPDWDRLTYGDSCHEPRGRSLLKTQKGDILLFWALLWKTDQNSLVFGSHEKGWYLIGAIRTEYIVYRYTARVHRDRFLASEGEGMTWMRQLSWQGIALFSVRTEFWRNTA